MDYHGRCRFSDLGRPELEKVRQKMKHATFLAVLAVFFLPVFSAVALTSGWFSWHSSRTKNHGELIQPPLELPGFSINTVSGTTVSRDDLKDRWQLLHYQPQACKKDCMDALYWMRQVRRAQDRHQPDRSEERRAGKERRARCGREREQ